MLTRRTRCTLTTALAMAAVLGGAVPAAADGGWGWTECEQNPHPGCELGAEGDGGGTAPDDGGGVPPRPPDTGGGEDTTPEKDDPDRMNCSYRPAPDYDPPPQAVGTSFDGSPEDGGGEPSEIVPAVFAGRTGSEPTVGQVADPKPSRGAGAWYVWQCSGTGVRDALYRPPVWIPEGPGGEGPGPSPAALARRAREQLQLPAPNIETSPSGDQLVRVPTWLWLEDWEPVSATASVPGVSVTATARPTKVEWTMGDGTTVECSGPGTPYRAAEEAPSSPSPDCGHTYTSSSAGEPREAYPVSVRVQWSVRWSGAGQSGTFPGLSTETSTSFRVLESQALTQ